MAGQLTVRDAEILRTLARVRLASTGLLARTFFPAPRLARRRLQALRERQLITAHNKGLPPGLSGHRYWRLTGGGLEAVARAFADEPIAENVLVRTASASLRQFEHRDALAELYVDLVRDVRGDIGEMRQRADAIRWAAEYDVVLPYQEIDGAEYVDRSIVPDATVELATTRVFIELDRSTESRARVRRALDAYRRYLSVAYEGQFADGRVPLVLYVTRSVARARNLQRVWDRLDGGDSVRVVVVAQAPAVLAALAFGEPSAERAVPATVDVDVELVRELYELARRGVEQRLETGEHDGAGAVPSCLHAAYALLAPYTT